MNKKVAIIGNGWVGKAMQDLFPEALVYVRNDNLLNDKDTFTNEREKINQCDIAFICVPTPSVRYARWQKVVGFDEGKLDTSAVEDVLEWCESRLIVIRSTVNPGDCERWALQYNREIVFQPEYLGETPNHPLLDTKNTPFLVIGGHPFAREKLINLYTTVYNANVSIRQMTLTEAEIVKLSENRAIAFKVAQCQELYDVCHLQGINYYTIRDAVYGDDPRFNLWWTFVYPEKRGFNSKCIPKDIYAWCAWAESLGYTPSITRAILKKNKEWIQ